MTNGHGTAHGGFIFALADSAFAFACNSYNERTVAQACDIVFAAPAHAGDELVADAAERHRFGRNGVYDVRVSCDDRVIAEFRGRSRTIGGAAGRRCVSCSTPADLWDDAERLSHRRAARRFSSRGSRRRCGGRTHRFLTTDRRSTRPAYTRATSRACPTSPGIPLTSKADLRDNYPFGMFAVPREDILRIHASSGTTGRPTVVGYTAERHGHLGRGGRALDPGGRWAEAATWFMSRTATGCSPVASAPTTAPNGWAARWSRSAAG